MMILIDLQIFDNYTTTLGVPMEKVSLIDKPHKELNQEPGGEIWHTLYGGYQTKRVSTCK
jgi:hypothetical protein